MSLESTPLYAGNADFLDTLYEQYQRDPASVAARWRALFDSWGPPPPAELPLKQQTVAAGGSTAVISGAAPACAPARRAVSAAMLALAAARPSGTTRNAMTGTPHPDEYDFH